MLILIDAKDRESLAVTLTSLYSNEMIFVKGGLWVRPVIKRFALGLVLTGETCPIQPEDGTLYIDSRVRFSLTFLTNLKRAREIVKGNLCPVCPSEIISDQLDPNFKLYNRMTNKEDLLKVESCRFIYYDTKAKETYQIQNEYAYPVANEATSLEQNAGHT